MTALAPRARALTTSEPRRTPPSITTSIWCPTVSAIGLTIRIAAGVPSRLLPPWLETESPETPASTARLASSMRHPPLTRNCLPPTICCDCSRRKATPAHEGGRVGLHPSVWQEQGGPWTCHGVSGLGS